MVPWSYVSATVAGPTERARREHRSKQELAIEAIRDAQNRAELKVDDVLAERSPQRSPPPRSTTRRPCWPTA
ncbi:hypothetical protein [Streptomyces sp. SYP-A7185]|uniref:hypothetical protein n=1 Tax=Streptomyces sp. SYP-A7185 TaxID=3040076 RepID=UPI0038F632CC